MYLSILLYDNENDGGTKMIPIEYPDIIGLTDDEIRDMFNLDKWNPSDARRLKELKNNNSVLEMI